MSIKIRRMNMPPEGLDKKWLDKDAREGVAITALPGGRPKQRVSREEEGMEI